MKSTARTIDIEKIFPALGVFGDIYVNVKGEYTIGYELTLPVVYSQTEREYDDVFECFAAAMRVLPPWTVVHRQDLYLKRRYDPSGLRTSGLLSKSYAEHFRGREYIEHKSYLFITASTKNGVIKPGKNCGIFGFADRYRYTDEGFAAFRTKCREFVTIVESCGRVRFRTLTERDWIGDDDTVGIVQRYMMFGSESSVMSDVDTTPSTVSVYGKTAVAFNIASADCLPGEFSTVSRIESLSTPGNDVYLSLGAKMGVLLDCEHAVNQILVVPAQEELIHRLDSERKKMVSGISSTDNRLNAEEIQEYLDDAYREGLLTVLCNTNIVAWAPEGGQLDLVSSVSSALTSMSVRAVYNRRDTPVIWYAGAPGNAFEIGKENLMTQSLQAALCLGTYETFFSGLENASFTTCDRMRNIPVGVDMTELARDLGWCGNYNGVIFGGSGTGKSFFTNSLVQNTYDRGSSVYIIDVGDSYEVLTRLINEESGGVDGQYLSWDTKHPYTFSAFNNWESWLNGHGGLHTDLCEVQCFLSFLQTVYVPQGGWHEGPKTILTQIVIDFIRTRIAETKKKPVFNDFYEFVNRSVSPRIKYQAAEPKNIKDPEKRKAKMDEMNRANGYYCDDVQITMQKFNVEDFILSMKNYANGGSYAFLLNDPAPRDLFNSRFVVFEVDKLSQDDPKFYSICILFMMNAFDQKMRSSQGRKTLIIEEAWKAIANETMAPFLAGIWKTSRKFSCSAFVVTQEIADVCNSPVIKTAIIDNSDIKVLLDQSNHANNFKPVQDFMSLTPKDRMLVLSINKALNPNYRYKEVFIKIGSVFSSVFATEVSEECAISFESEKKQKAPLFALAEKLGSVSRAIQNMAADKRRGNTDKQMEMDQLQKIMTNEG